MNKIAIRTVRLAVIIIAAICSDGFAENTDTTTTQPAASGNEANKPVWSFNTGVEQWSGYTKYQIGGDVTWSDGSTDRVHFPLSELDFPLDVYAASIGAELAFLKKWSVGLTYKTNITDDAGEMKDSDWGVFSSNTNRLDIYSESDAELDANVVDLNGRYMFFQNRSGCVKLYAGIGYQYQNFDYIASNAVQWSPSIPSLGYVYFPGKVLTYEVTYHIFYGEVAAVYAINQFTIEASLGLGGVTGEDEDHHLLRGKVSKGEFDGAAGMFSLKANYDFTAHWSAFLGVDSVYIEAEGEDDSYFYGSYSHTIEHEVESEQTSVAGGVEFTL
jgi:outer membrane protease